MNKRRRGWGGWAIALAGVWRAWGGAAAFGADSVVVLRVGDGVASLTGNATPVFLDEFGLSGALRQTLALPTVSSSDALTLRGTNSGEGAMSLSGDGRSLTLAGYGLAAGQRRTTTTPWTVASVSAPGEVALSTWSSLGSSPSLTAAGGSLTSPWIGTSQGAFGNVHSWTTLATAATDTTFRGLALAPVAVAEASEAALALIGLGCCLLVARRRQARGVTASINSSPHAPAADGSAPAGAARP